MRLFHGISFLASLSVAFALKDPTWIDTNSLRTIDLQKSYVRETRNVVIENNSDRPQSIYRVPISNHNGNNDEKKNLIKVKEKQSTVPIHWRQTETCYEINLPREIEPKGKITLSLSSVTVDRLVPIPFQMEQNGKQFLQFSTNATLPSFYETQREKIKIKVKSGEIASYTEGGEKQSDGIITYGPYGSKETVNPPETIVIRYEHTAPITQIAQFEREIQVSHLGGNIAFEEHYALFNKAAKLKHQFDRIAYAQSAYYNPQSTAIKHMNFKLQIGARDAYFVDEIGNVSTSRFRSNSREASLEIRPRYPVFGGWNYSFAIGWNNDLDQYLHINPNNPKKYLLCVPFLEGADDVAYGSVAWKLVLPEGASNVELATRVPVLSMRHSVEKTFMDTIGRTVVTLTARDLTDEGGRQDVCVAYEYSTGLTLRKPLVVTMAVFAVFLASLVGSRLPTKIG